MTDSRHIVFIADESILPADHGGRLAMSNDVKALSAAGFTVSIIVSVDAPQAPSMSDHYAFEFVSAVHFTPRRRDDVARGTHPSVPQAASVRLPDEEGLRSLRAFLDTQPIPTAIVASHESSLLLGDWIATSSRAPLLLRSHNDEIDYLRTVASNSTSPDEAREFLSEATLLEEGFRALLEPVRAVALISPDDATRYTDIGKPTAFVPALTAELTASVRTFGARELKAVFVGTLTMPHTAAGLQWFIQRVWPKIFRSLPAAELAIAGRGAPDSLLESFEQTPGATYLGRIDDVQVLLESARVFVNPVFHGSGVNMKLAQPAAGGVPIVATTFGMRGAPGLAAAVEPSNRPTKLARQTLRYLQDPVAWARESEALRDVMSTEHSGARSAQAWNDFVSANASPAPIDEPTG